MVAWAQCLAHQPVSSSAGWMEILGRDRAWVRLNNRLYPQGQQVAGPTVPAPSNQAPPASEHPPPEPRPTHRDDVILAKTQLVVIVSLKV